MTIEEKAYIAVPEWRIDTPKGNVDINEDYRDKWIQGYEQALKDIGIVSEDERIKKKIIDIVKAAPFDEEKDVLLAWLEKQKTTNAEGDFARGYDCGYECCLHSHGAEWGAKNAK